MEHNQLIDKFIYYVYVFVNWKIDTHIKKEQTSEDT